METQQIAHPRDDRLSLWLLVLACTYALFHIVPVFLDYEIQHRLMVGDLFDIFTPFAMIFLVCRIYWMLGADAGAWPRSSAIIILIVGAITFVEGHGMHLSANAIARHLTPVENASLFRLDYFFDEMLGHILWDSGILLLSVGMILMGLWVHPEKVLNPNPILIPLASLFYGFTYFVNAVEGQTTVFTFPLAVVLPVVIWWLAHRRGSLFLSNVVLSFYFFAYFLASCLFIFWSVWHKGIPQFSELGWI